MSKESTLEGEHPADCSAHNGRFARNTRTMRNLTHQTQVPAVPIIQSQAQNPYFSGFFAQNA